jgi:hypothetical protein
MKVFIALAILLTTTVASAGILIEPQVGYILSNKYSGTVGLTSGSLVGSTTGDYKSTGPEYGARVGYQVLGFMTGLNYGHSSGKSKNSDGTTDDLKSTNIGAFIGYKAPILFRAWLAYNFSTKTSLDTNDLKGNSTEIGLGYTGLPFLSINAIYRMYKYTEVTNAGVTYTATNYNPTEIELAISAPFSLF